MNDTITPPASELTQIDADLIRSSRLLRLAELAQHHAAAAYQRQLINTLLERRLTLTTGRTSR